MAMSHDETEIEYDEVNREEQMELLQSNWEKDGKKKAMEPKKHESSNERDSISMTREDIERLINNRIDERLDQFFSGNRSSNDDNEDAEKTPRTEKNTR
jgi:hypothetical protein